MRLCAHVMAESRQLASQEDSSHFVGDTVNQDSRIPSDLHVYSSDFKAAKQSADVLTQLWAQVRHVSSTQRYITFMLRYVRVTLGLCVWLACASE